MKTEALVIVDMQEGFSASYKKSTQIECQNLIKSSIQKDIPIVVLEYKDNDNDTKIKHLQTNYGKTQKCLSSLYSKYDKSKVLKKNDDSGAPNVHRFLKKRYPNVREVIVCGVNIDACVLETVAGLSYRGYNVKVVKRACNTTHYYKSWSHFKGMENTEII